MASSGLTSARSSCRKPVIVSWPWISTMTRSNTSWNPETLLWIGRIQLHSLNIKHDSRLEGLIKIIDMVTLNIITLLPSQLVISFLVPLSLTILSLFQTINLAASCTHKDYNTCPLYTIYSNFIDVLPVVCLTFTLLSLSLSLSLYVYLFYCENWN